MAQSLVTKAETAASDSSLSKRSAEELLIQDTWSNDCTIGAELLF
jgi:hypothetical protein